MKKIFLLTVIAILLTALTSCDPEPIPPPVNYAISTNTIGNGLVTPDNLSGVSLGSDVTFKIKPEAGYSIYSIKINGTLVEGFQPSASETSYTVKDIKSNLYIEFTFVETDILILSVKSVDEKPWRLKVVKSYKVDDNTYLRDFPLDKEDRSDRYYYLYPSMTAVVLEEDGGVRNGTWNLKQKVLTIDGHAYPLLELTPNKFSYQTEEVWSGYDNCWIYHIVNFGRD